LHDALQKPPWIKVRAPTGELFVEMKSILDRWELNTVCVASRCPNLPECWSSGNATFMILGNTCTRHCRFCAIPTANIGTPPDPDEPIRIAGAVAELGLEHAVITSVTRDDLRDQGASQFVDVVGAIRRAIPQTTIELLIPDMQGRRHLLTMMAESGPDVIGHNLETVRRLQGVVRDKRSDYDLSLKVLATLHRQGTALTKSSLMLGLGEREEEVEVAMDDLLEAGVQMLTLGQYLKPAGCPLEVREYLSPDTFERLRERAIDAGFRSVVSGPLVRSSYRAHEAMRQMQEVRC
jgi:lipoyl synthase